MGVAVRDYVADRDDAALRACFVELQEAERAIDPRMPSGESIADAYLATMFERCAAWAGRVFVADADGRVVGFVTVWGRMPPQEIDDEPVDTAYVSDLVVVPASRGRGIGAALLARAEAHARAQGVASIGLGVMARNVEARRLYERLGYEPLHVEMRKPLS
jgi:ribosomal protein S18 acetylase RimI-like enzyme